MHTDLQTSYKSLIFKQSHWFAVEVASLRFQLHDFSQALEELTSLGRKGFAWGAEKHRKIDGEIMWVDVDLYWFKGKSVNLLWYVLNSNHVCWVVWIGVNLMLIEWDLNGFYGDSCLFHVFSPWCDFRL